MLQIDQRFHNMSFCSITIFGKQKFDNNYNHFLSLSVYPVLGVFHGRKMIVLNTYQFIHMKHTKNSTCSIQFINAHSVTLVHLEACL